MSRFYKSERLRKKKVAIVATQAGTLDTFVKDIAVFLVDSLGVDITLICSPDSGFEKRLPRQLKYVPINMKRGISLSGIKSAFDLYRLFRKEKYDLVQYSTPNAAFYAATASWLAGIPVRLYCQWGILYVSFSGIKRFIFKAVEKWICDRSTIIEPDSAGNMDYSVKEGLYKNDKARVIWNGSAKGLNLTRFDYSQREQKARLMREKNPEINEKTILSFIGRVNRDKGCDELFEAYFRLKEKYNNLFLFVIGDIEAPDSVNQTLLQKAKNDSSIVFTGVVSNVEDYLSITDIFVMPSYREGFGMSVIEAQAMGVPVVVTDIPGPTNGMINGVTGLVCKVKNVDSLTDKLEELISDSDKRETFGLAGVEYVRSHFDEIVFREYILEDRKRLLGIE